MAVNLDRYEPLLRQILRDIPTQNEQGFFWDTTALAFALDLSQLMFCKYAIATKQHYFLWRLMIKIEPSDSVYRFSENDAELMYPMTAWVKDDEDKLYNARIYLGDGAAFLNTGHNACVILNDVIQFFRRNRANGGVIPSRGILYYYRYPARVELTAARNLPASNLPPIEQDFDDYIYEQYIIPYAAVILGMKEITNQRDQKIFQRYLQDIFNIPSNFANYIFDFEFTGIKVRPGRPPSQDITEE